jgi:hypothetical protein
VGIHLSEWPDRGVARPEWRGKWPAPSAQMSTHEATEAPVEPESDGELGDEAPDEASVPLAKPSEASMKLLISAAMGRLLIRAPGGLTAGKPRSGTNRIRSTEAAALAALGSLVGLVHEIFLCTRYHLTGRKLFGLLRELFPRTETVHWKSGAQTFLINVTVEKRECAVLDMLAELVKTHKGTAAALTDYGDSDDAHRACARRVCKVLADFHTSTLVIPKPAAKPKPKPKPNSTGGGSSTTPTTPTTGRVALTSSAEELAAHDRSQLHRAAVLLSKNSSPILQSKNLSPGSRKRFRESLEVVSEALVAQVPSERPAGALGPHALALLQYIADTGAKTLKADVGRVKLQQRSLFAGEGEEAVAEEEEAVAAAAEEEEVVAEEEEAEEAEADPGWCE